MAPSVTLFMPTLNEVTGMRAIMPRVDPSWYQQILVVDGGSTDGTVEYAREHGYEVHVQRRRGLRFAYSEAFPLVRGDIVVTFSPDGNSIPELIPDVAAKVASGYDMVIVSRYLGPAKSHDDDFLTGFGNWFFTNTINLLHRAPYTDAMVMFRAYPAHPDPAGSLAVAIRAARADAERDGRTLHVVASVVGTDADPQNRAAQIAALEAAGVDVLPSNAQAARFAALRLDPALAQKLPGDA